jgi:5-formyltetrahydrofolate cyclo-ligase
MADEKTYLRQILRETREALAVSAKDRLSREIQSRLLAAKPYLQASVLVLYAPIGNEVGTDLLFADALSRRRKVYFPRTRTEDRSIALVEVSGLSDLSPGTFGIPEPRDGVEVEPRNLGQALVCVPGVAFSPSGHRLGRGGGYYDRLISELSPETMTVGLAYSFQMLDTLPEHASDRRVRFIATESGVRAVKGIESAADHPTIRGGTSPCPNS